jgi:hypothetical protein
MTNTFHSPDRFPFIFVNLDALITLDNIDYFPDPDHYSVLDSAVNGLNNFRYSLDRQFENIVVFSSTLLDAPLNSYDLVEFNHKFDDLITHFIYFCSNRFDPSSYRLCVHSFVSSSHCVLIELLSFTFSFSDMLVQFVTYLVSRGHLTVDQQDQYKTAFVIADRDPSYVDFSDIKYCPISLFHQRYTLGCTSLDIPADLAYLMELFEYSYFKDNSNYFLSLSSESSS